MPIRPLIRLTLSLLLVAACSKAKTTDKRESEPVPPPPAKKPDFSLTLPEDQWVASKFCGDVAPAKPVDPTPAYTFTEPFLDDKLANDGLTGWMHGVVVEYNQFVFTYRSEDKTDEMAFFKAEQFSLIPANDDIKQILLGLHRHDKVRLHGSRLPNKAPLVHIVVSAIDVIKRYPLSTENLYPFDATTLNGQDTFQVFGMVHATLDSEQYGRAFVIERDNFLMPVIVDPKDNDAAAKLYRGDIVNIYAKLIPHEGRPPHIATDPDAAQAINVIDPLLNCHGQSRTLTGTLVKFDKSPAIIADTYAVQIADSNGMIRNFTFFPANSDDPDAFTKLIGDIRKKASAAWDGSAADPVVVRNYHKKDQIQVTVTGVMNVVSTEQANPQVYLKSVDDLTFQTTP